MSTELETFKCVDGQGEEIEVVASNGVRLWCTHADSTGVKIRLDETNVESFLDSVVLAAKMQGIKLINY